MENLPESQPPAFLTPQPQQPQNPTEPKKSKAFIWILVIVVLILSGIRVFAYLSKKPQKNFDTQTSTPPPSAPAEKPLEPESSKQKFLESSKITFPEIQSNSPASLADLPADLSSLIVNETVENIQKVSYTNGKLGFIFNFNTSGQAAQVRQKYGVALSRAPWKFIYGRYNDFIAITEAESPNYEIRFIQIPLANNNNQITIQTLTK